MFYTKPIVASLLASSLLVASMAPRSSEAAVIISATVSRKMADQDGNHVRHTKFKRGLFLGIVGLVGVYGLSIYGVIGSLPVIPAWGTGLIFLDKDVTLRGVGEIQVADLTANGYSEAEAQLISADNDRFRELLRTSEQGVEVTTEDTEANVAEAIRTVYPGASDLFTSLMSRNMLLAVQAN